MSKTLARLIIGALAVAMVVACGGGTATSTPTGGRAGYPSGSDNADTTGGTAKSGAPSTATGPPTASTDAPTHSRAGSGLGQESL